MEVLERHPDLALRQAMVVAREAVRTPLADLLGHLGFTVELYGEFRSARERLGPALDLLVTELRLGAYNGLHLVALARAASIPAGAIVIATREDAVVRSEAERLGATLIAIPTARSEWTAAILRTAAAAMRSGPRDAIRPPFERRRVSRDLSSAAVARGR